VTESRETYAAPIASMTRRSTQHSGLLGSYRNGVGPRVVSPATKLEITQTVSQRFSPGAGEKRERLVLESSDSVQFSVWCTILSKSYGDPIGFITAE
jgi:hypothetical protein